MDILFKVLANYGFEREECSIQEFGSGLINNTCLVKYKSEVYILQRVNEKVFRNPFLIADNIDKIQDCIQRTDIEYYFAAPSRTLDGKSLLFIDDHGYYRLFPFVPGSHTIDVVETAHQAFEAAKQFGGFTNVLRSIDIDSLNITLPDFHNLTLRYQQFLTALENGNLLRLKECETVIQALKDQEGIVADFEKIKKNPEFKLRVTHHDTKISNVLFDENNNGLCVIDLDTVMQGYFISDVGDMMRTYLSPVSEEEADFSKIVIRDDFYKAIVQGYDIFMHDELSATEKQYFFYSGKFMIYMQALRFITDYLNDDVYYGAKYSGHNFVRGVNQLTLLNRLLEKEEALSGV